MHTQYTVLNTTVNNLTLQQQVKMLALTCTILTFTYADGDIKGIILYWVNPLTKPTALTVCAPRPSGWQFSCQSEQRIQAIQPVQKVLGITTAVGDMGAPTTHQVYLAIICIAGFHSSTVASIKSVTHAFTTASSCKLQKNNACIICVYEHSKLECSCLTHQSRSLLPPIPANLQKLMYWLVVFQHR